MAAERVLRQSGFHPQVVTRDKQASLFGEKARFSELSVYVVHASLLLIFLGGIVDALYGWKGFLALTRGEHSSQIEVRNSTKHTIPFEVRCDAAGQENYADGSPKRWWSKLVVVENGREVMRKEIAVNDPLVYRGVRFYQASYGDTGKVDKLVLTVTRADGKGSSQEISLAVGGTAVLNAGTTVHLAEFLPDYVVRDGQVYTRSNYVDNPAVHLVVRASGDDINVWIPPIPGFAQNAESPYKFEVQDLKMGYFTGLQVSHEPGQWAVWAGVILMGLGLGCVFYLVHQRVWAVPLLNQKGQWVLWIGGAANKNKDAFEERFKRLVEEIHAEVNRNKPRMFVREEETSVAGVTVR
jgi:cytochrome c biogenesis protein